MKFDDLLMAYNAMIERISVIKSMMFGKEMNLEAKLLDDLRATVRDYLASIGKTSCFIDQDCCDMYSDMSFKKGTADIIVVENASKITDVEDNIEYFRKGKLDNIIVVITDFGTYYTDKTIIENIKKLHKTYPHLSATELFRAILVKDNPDLLPEEFHIYRERYMKIKEDICQSPQ